MKTRLTAPAIFVCLLASVMPVMAASYSGMITATRDASRSIVSAVLETTNRDGAGNPVAFNIVMNENGKAVAEQYENKDVKIDGALQGKDLTVDTWEGINLPASSGSSGSSGSSDPEPSYDEPAPTDEPADVEPGDEEPKDDEPKDDEPKDDEPKDDEPKDDEPSDDEPKDEEPKDEEPKDEEPKDETPSED